MLRTVTSYGLLASALLAPGLFAQAQSTAPGKKVVTYDQGHHWPANMLLRTDGALQAIPNQLMFDGGSRTVGSQIHDIATVPAHVRGQNERVIAVGVNGATTLTWQAGTALDASNTGADPVGSVPPPGTMVTTAWNQALLNGATAVRALSFQVVSGDAAVPVSAAAFRLASGSTIAVYRVGAPGQANQLLAQIAVGMPVRDFALVTNSLGQPRVLVWTNSFVRNYSVAGAFDPLWDVSATAGTQGKFVPVQGATNWQVGWLHTNPQGQWLMGSFNDLPVNFTTKAVGLPPGQSVVSAFAVKLGSDSAVDLVVRTQVATKVFAGGVSSYLPAQDQSVVGQATDCETSLVVTEGGRKVREARFVPGEGVVWGLMPNLTLSGGTVVSNLMGANPALSIRNDGRSHWLTVADLPLLLMLGVRKEFLDEQVELGVNLENYLHVQFMSWVQETTLNSGATSSEDFVCSALVEEDNWITQLGDSRGSYGGVWRASLDMVGPLASLLGDVPPSGAPSAYLADRSSVKYHFWAARLLIGPDPSDPVVVSDPIVFGSSLDATEDFVRDQTDPDIDVVHPLQLPGVPYPYLPIGGPSISLRQFILADQNTFPCSAKCAGDPIGVITDVGDIGPAPRIEDLPSPRKARVSGVSPKQEPLPPH